MKIVLPSDFLLSVQRHKQMCNVQIMAHSRNINIYFSKQPHISICYYKLQSPFILISDRHLSTHEIKKMIQILHVGNLQVLMLRLRVKWPV